MPDGTEELLLRYRRNGVVLDANLLVLLIAGLHDRRRISTFKRTKQYAPEDFDLLDGLLSTMERLVVTPGILTEASNLVTEAHLPVPGLLISRLEEHHTPSAELASDPLFDRFGLTDTAVADLAGEHLVLADDFRLSEVLRSKGHAVLNFNHLRPLNWR